ncbi:ethanolamine ammonia-lyase subunit EutC [Consotaella salsifontis]|uniref:Ethanolamine ammonia-lyase small subunit n=1 Tax=Consotaella salsifontis TaxID=1365950 RepID=A0A1T4S7X4_9HYPH|nr:ethanolamine ammonia-lyase subunit EutC [Consotaella salsifontis]SKA24257.1 Ethanolamine ammonia-lyase light chain [Consotaella salsifontis]
MSKEDVARPRRFDIGAFRELTEARIALGRPGAALPTKAEQTFLLDHARARAAVWSEVDWTRISAALNASELPSLPVASAAADRQIYVRRPDLGRQLCAEGAEALDRLAGSFKVAPDITIVIGDGLSATAVDFNAAPLATALAERLKARGMTLAPIILAERARVALGDPIGKALGAKVVVILIGERPGLSAADSLGAYLTFAPEPGTPDSRRNCLSNIREGGLTIERAAASIADLCAGMIKAGLSGVGLQAALEREGSASVSLTADEGNA